MAFREALGLDGAAAASFFGESLGFAGAASAGRESAGALAMGGCVSPAATAVVELPFVLVSEATASRGAGRGVALDCAVGLSEDVTRSSTTAPPMTVKVIVANAMPKWLTEPSGLDVMGIGTGSVEAVAGHRKESEAAYTSACSLPTWHLAG